MPRRPHIRSAMIANVQTMRRCRSLNVTSSGLRLSPAYDLVAAALYPEYKTFALAIGGAANLTIDQITP